MPISAEKRVKSALHILTECGGYDGGHHKAWAIDQAIRALCGVPCDDWNGTPGKQVNDEYKKHVFDACNGEDGPGTYDWDCGVPP